VPSYLSLCSPHCLLHLLVFSCVSLRLPASPCVSLRLPASPASPASPCISLRLPASPCVSLCLPAFAALFLPSLTPIFAALPCLRCLPYRRCIFPIVAASSGGAPGHCITLDPPSLATSSLPESRCLPVPPHKSVSSPARNPGVLRVEILVQGNELRLTPALQFIDPRSQTLDDGGDRLDGLQ
jgi:hypothetical protein